eukprot:s1558_g21.t1
MRPELGTSRRWRKPRVAARSPNTGNWRRGYWASRYCPRDPTLFRSASPESTDQYGGLQITSSSSLSKGTNCSREPALGSNPGTRVAGCLRASRSATNATKRILPQCGLQAAGGDTTNSPYFAAAPVWIKALAQLRTSQRGLCSTAKASSRHWSETFSLSRKRRGSARRRSPCPVSSPCRSKGTVRPPLCHTT